ncbi:MAG: hypothetical protein ACPIOQ_64585, partial [Promethearchaeia archaeon]
TSGGSSKERGKAEEKNMRSLFVFALITCASALVHDAGTSLRPSWTRQPGALSALRGGMAKKVAAPPPPPPQVS